MLIGGYIRGLGLRVGGLRRLGFRGYMGLILGLYIGILEEKMETTI